MRTRRTGISVNDKTDFFFSRTFFISKKIKGQKNPREPFSKKKAMSGQIFLNIGRRGKYRIEINIVYYFFHE